MFSCVWEEWVEFAFEQTGRPNLVHWVVGSVTAGEAFFIVP